MRSYHGIACVLAVWAPLAAQQSEEVTFRSDVSLVRVDVQVLDRSGNAVMGLNREDFTLRENGRDQPVRNFASEEMPIDILFLFDVSRSMRPHIESVARASREAFNVLGPQDRIGVMVFDRSARMRMEFRDVRNGAQRQLEKLIDDESFDGGTDIPRGLQAAARYVAQHAREEARRAIVIVTDDQTEFESDVPGVLRSLHRAEIVLSALLARDAMGTGTMGGGGWPTGGGGGWPGGGWPRRRGGIIFGGPQIPVGGTMGGGTNSAGTAEMARESGGDSMSVMDASSLETTLTRLRQRYALYFHAPDGVQAGQERSIEVQLAPAIARRYAGAMLRYRKYYNSGKGNSSSPAETVVVSQTTPAAGSADPPQTTDKQPEPAPRMRRRGPVSEPSGARGPNPAVGSQQPVPPPGGWRRADSPEPEAAKAPATSSTDPNPPGRWRRLKPGEQP